jgi:hypothetical protein
LVMIRHNRKIGHPHGTRWSLYFYEALAKS